MKTYPLTMAERHFLDVPPLQTAKLWIYEAEAGDGWASPAGSFMVADAGWNGEGPLPGTVALNRGAALVAWSANRAGRTPLPA